MLDYMKNWKWIIPIVNLHEQRRGKWHTLVKKWRGASLRRRKYALIEAAEERRKSEASVNGGDGVRSLDDFENDPVAEAFGGDKRKSYFRAISSTSNIKQVKLTQASKTIINYKENANQQWRIEMQTSHNQMHEEMKTMSSALINVRQCIKLLVNPTGGNAMTQRTEDASITEHGPASPVDTLDVPLNGVTRSSIGVKQPVKLLSKDSDVVAEGHIGMQKICHGRKVVEGKKVVWVEEVLDPEAAIFEAPQNGIYTLSELVGGGFVIWPEYRLRY